MEGVLASACSSTFLKLSSNFAGRAKPLPSEPVCEKCWHLHDGDGETRKGSEPKLNAITTIFLSSSSWNWVWVFDGTATKHTLPTLFTMLTCRSYRKKKQNSPNTAHIQHARWNGSRTFQLIAHYFDSKKICWTTFVDVVVGCSCSLVLLFGIRLSHIFETAKCLICVVEFACHIFSMGQTARWYTFVTHRAHPYKDQKVIARV